MTDKNKNRKDQNASLDRRAFVAGAAGLAATVIGTQQARGGAHEVTSVDLSDDDKTAKPVGEGAVILVTGANRGLGFEFTRQYAERGARIIATCRNPDRAEALQALAADNPAIDIDKLDVTDLEAIDALAAKYDGQPIDVLLNNAGIGGGIENQMFGKMVYPVFYDVISVNVVGPMKMCEAFRKNVEASNLKKMIAVSSSQGSITQVRGPMLYWYRSSKSALNMQMVNLAYQLVRKKIIVGLVTPGATATDFIPEPFRSRMPNIQTPEQATSDMIRNIDRFSVANTGTFFDYDGSIVPW